MPGNQSQLKLSPTVFWPSLIHKLCPECLAVTSLPRLFLCWTLLELMASAVAMAVTPKGPILSVVLAAIGYSRSGSGSIQRKPLNPGEAPGVFYPTVNQRIFTLSPPNDLFHGVPPYLKKKRLILRGSWLLICRGRSGGK